MDRTKQFAAMDEALKVVADAYSDYTAALEVLRLHQSAFEVAHQKWLAACEKRDVLWHAMANPAGVSNA